MNWGRSIILAFVCFAGVIATMVTISMKQEVNLVADDYYKQEIAYQDQIERKDNYSKLKIKPEIKIDQSRQSLELIFPEEYNSNAVIGELHMFRPSTSKWDKKFILALDEDGKQKIDITSLPSGVWKAKMNWKSGGKEYYTEKVLNK